jgi:L-ribulose-5-phosphate 4-epimerase
MVFFSFKSYPIGLCSYLSLIAFMAEQEGVIKYRLDYRPAPASNYPELAELNAWRSILYRLGLIGQDPQRYGGLGFGNLSFRLDHTRQFVITGSQTGGLEHLTPDHYCRILHADAEQNHIIAEGANRPSSEALTHAAVYEASQKIQAVIHIHSPIIWRYYQALALPAVAGDIRYGTPAMATAVLDLFRQERLVEISLFVMLGHEDGVVAFGDSIAEASQTLIKTLASALRLAYGE